MNSFVKTYRGSLCHLCIDREKGGTFSAQASMNGVTLRDGGYKTRLAATRRAMELMYELGQHRASA